MATGGKGALNNLKQSQLDTFIFNEIQIILAEKRTSLSSLRTGIAIFALPLSVLSILIATSKLYNILSVINFLIPLFILNVGLIVLGTYLIIHSIIRLKHLDELIKTLKKEHSALREFLK